MELMKNLKIKRGDQLGKVGHLVGIKVPSDMLHLELYETTESPKKTGLTQKGKGVSAILCKREIV